MKRILSCWSCFCIASIVQSEITFAYEVLTHEDISQKALEASVLKSDHPYC